MTASGILRRTSQGDDGQMLPAPVEVNREHEAIPWLSGDERASFGTGRATGPERAWLDTRLTIGWSQSEVHFVWRPASKCHVRAVVIVPSEERIDLPAKVCSVLRNLNPARGLVFQNLDESLDHCDAAVLSRGTGTRRS